MPIKGIDKERCSICQECIKECVMRKFSLDEDKKVILFNSSEHCILCGHCIAVCSENAIIYENMKDSALNFEELNDSTQYDILFKLMRSKRSVRRYLSKQVPYEMIEKIIESIRYAPSAINLRTLKCILISGKKKIGEFTDSIIDTIKSEEEKEGLKKLREKRLNPFFYNAPHILILHSNNGWVEINATIAITYAMLYAEALGLGSCWIGGIQKYLVENREISEKVIGNSDKVGGIMIFGYPAVKYSRVPPRPPIEIKAINDLE